MKRELSDTGKFPDLKLVMEKHTEFTDEEVTEGINEFMKYYNKFNGTVV